MGGDRRKYRFVFFEHKRKYRARREGIYRSLQGRMTEREKQRRYKDGGVFRRGGTELFEYARTEDHFLTRGGEHSCGNYAKRGARGDPGGCRAFSDREHRHSRNRELKRAAEENGAEIRRQRSIAGCHAIGKNP